MASRKRPDQQDNCSHGQYERENEAECRIALCQTIRYCTEASGLRLGYSPEGIEHPDNDWNGQSPSEDHPQKERLSLAVVAGAIVHLGN